jgi:oligopeptide transport system ATP-binding protein
MPSLEGTRMNGQENGNHLLEVYNLVKYYPVYSRGIILRRVVGYVHAVDKVTLYIDEGKTLGLVGESGSGKTTTGKAILHLEWPTAGQVFFEGANVSEVLKSKDKKQILKIRKSMQMIFQNPYGSLDPRMTVFDIIAEPLKLHGHYSKEEINERVYKLLEMVGLEAYHAERYPHEFSGGQRQRIGIARALAVEPKIIIADEPVSSLDVSVRAQILNLLMNLQKENKLSLLYISHDLSSVRQICDHVAVMYLGKIVETANVEDLFSKPLHPYTQALLSAVPIPDPELKRRRIILHGEVPSAINPPPGCRFHTRCPYAKEVCKNKEPELREVEKNHFVACHLV